MFSYIEKLFLTEKTTKRIDKIKEDINNKKYISRVCLIILSESNDVFDIVPVINLKLNSIYEKDVHVLGIAENKKAAIKLCAEMTALYFSMERNETMKDYFRGYL